MRTGIKDVIHRSFPYGGGPRPAVVNWPVIMGIPNVSHIVVMSRDPYACAQSQIDSGHVNTVYQALYNIAEAQRRIWVQVDSMQVNVYSLPYEALVMHPTVIHHLCEWMGHDYKELDLLAILELVQDANDKYYGGSVFRDQRSVEERFNGKKEEDVYRVQRKEE